MIKQPASRLYISFVVVLFALVAISLYEIITPHRAADDYLTRLQTSGSQLKVSFKKIDKTDNLNVFNNPDTAAQTSAQNLATIDTDIQECQRQLAAFQKVANSLKRPPLTMSVGAMHKAEVQRTNAHTIVAQSQDVLNQYQQLSDFLKSYYSYEQTFIAATSSVNKVTDLSTLAPEVSRLNAQATQLKQISAALAGQAPPQGYQQLTAAAAPMYARAAQGFSELASGLASGSDDQANAGIALIEAAVNTHDSSVANLPTHLDDNAYIFQQVDELPDKIANLFS